MRVVVLTSRFPYPEDKGDKLRIFQQVKALSEHHEVCLIAIHSKAVPDEDIEAVRKHCAELHVFYNNRIDLGLNVLRAFFRGIPLQVGVFYSPRHDRPIREIVNRFRPDALYCHLIRMGEYARQFSGIRRVIDFMDCFSKGAERWYNSASWPLKPVLRMEHKRLLAYEKRMLDLFDAHSIITEQDQQLFPHPLKSQIHIVPNGVDWEAYAPVGPDEGEKKYDILFMGYMGYAPNIEAASYFVEKVMPLLRKQKPGIRMLIAGHTPARRVLELACEDVDVIPNWKVIRDSFVISRVMVAPMLISIGLQNKILQALAMKIPTVCSPMANGALGAPPDSIIEAATPEAYADAVVRLLENPDMAAQMAENGYNFVRSHYDWAAISPKLEAILAGRPVATATVQPK